MADSAQAVPSQAAGQATPASWGFTAGVAISPGYRAMRVLGGGNTFEVYRAWDEHRLAVVVCKTVRPDQIRDGRGLRHLRREAGLLARLSHPVILRSLGAVLAGPCPHLVLEHVDKVTLRRRLRLRGPLPLERALPLARNLGAALHYLSTQGVVHLDVKPSNILLGSTPRLIDLSVARTVDRARRLQRPVGTTNYMAPEQCLPTERGPAGPAADMWGLGVTLYEALSGRLPFRFAAGESATEGERYPQLSAEPRPLPDIIPTNLADLVMQCLRPDPAARPAAGDFVAALGPVAASLPGAPIADWPAPPVRL